MIKHPHTSLVVLLLIIICYPIIAIEPARAENQILLPVEVEAKLGSDIVLEISRFTEGNVIDGIVVYDWKEGPEHLETIQESVKGLIITKHWDLLRMFRANLTRTQILKLAELPSVTRIDNNTREIITCMDDARNYTNVDYLRSLYPDDFDGNRDGDENSYSKDDLVIAILDTGIDTSHQDLAPGKVIGWVDFINGFETPYDDHYFLGWGHGTHCASIAAGEGDANWDYRGVAPYAALVGVKIANWFGDTDKQTCIQGLEWVGNHASEYGIEVVSCSWGFTDYGEYDAVAIAADNLVCYHDLVVCAAAGNEGNQGYDTIRTPGTGKYVITVGAALDPSEGSGGNWELWNRSGRGPCDDGRVKPDILAPGGEPCIMSAKMWSGSGYENFGGTSAATPFIAGLAGLFLDYDYSLRYNDGTHQHPDFKLLLMASAVDMPDDSNPGKDNDYGSGRIDAWVEKSFFDTDISDSFDDAPIALYYQWGGHFSRDNEPLWRGVVDAYADFYKVYAYAGMYIGAIAIGDYDLTLRVYLYDKYRNLITMSSWGRIKYVQHWATYTGLYYVRVSPHTTPTSGDYYDMDIYTEGS